MCLFGNRAACAMQGDTSICTAIYGKSGDFFSVDAEES
jgi:hypothetical protein